MTSFQLLSCRVEIRHDDPGLQHVFRYLAGRARQAALVRTTFHYEVRGSSPFEIHEEGDIVDTVDTPDAVLYVVYSRAHHRAIERFVLSGWVLVHAALVEIHRRRMLILGHQGSGKTTLAARLLYSGQRVEGDELAMEKNGLVVSLPRLLHLKPGIERHVPELQPILADLPRNSAGEAYIAALDPAALGFDWRIAARPVDDVVWLTPNHGGPTTLVWRTPFETIRRILEGAPGWGEPRQTVVAAATRLGRSGGYELTLGDPNEGVRCLERGVAEGALKSGGLLG